MTLEMICIPKSFTANAHRNDTGTHVRISGGREQWRQFQNSYEDSLVMDFFFVPKFGEHIKINIKKKYLPVIRCEIREQTCLSVSIHVHHTELYACFYVFAYPEIFKWIYI